MRAWVVLVVLLAPLAQGVEGAPAPWWGSTLADLDRDGIDDTLPRDGVEPLVVLATFDRIPTAGDLARLARAGFPVVRSFDHFDVAAVRALPRDLPRLADVPGVVLVERNDRFERALAESVPLLGVPLVWETYGATGAGSVVAILDDGVFEGHPDLRAKLAASYDAAGPDLVEGVGGLLPLDLPVLPADTESHATHVAGALVGAGESSDGLYKGAAPDARFVDVKVFSGPGTTSSDLVLRGLDWTLSNADRLGIRVITMSLSGSPSDGKDAVSRAADIAVAEGFVVVAAAGNGGPEAGTITSPGAAERAITVGAVTKTKEIASYSARGPTLDGRAKPDVVAPGTAIVSTVPPASLGSVTDLLAGDSDLFYGERSGTSMAAPQVAGIVALMLEVDPTLPPGEIKRILLATAQDLDAPGPDPATGAGFVNAIAAVQVAEDPTLLDPIGLAATTEVSGSPAALGAPWWALLAGLALLAVILAAGLVWMRGRRGAS